MISQPVTTTERTLWGLSPLELHDRYWAALGVQVVRCGDHETEISRSAELYLLLTDQSMVLFDLRPCLEYFTVLDPSLLRVRVLDKTQPKYAERLRANEDGTFLRYERNYRRHLSGNTMRVGLTESREIAGNWAAIRETQHRWRVLTATAAPTGRIGHRLEGTFSVKQTDEAADHVIRELPKRWNRPDMTIEGIKRHQEGWMFASDTPPANARLVGRVWIGAGEPGRITGPVVGPDVVWDDPAARPQAEPLRWFSIEPKAKAIEVGIERQSAHATSIGKRLFDIVFSAIVLLMLLPLFPIIALAVLIEDGRPIFFVHKRESIGGREFGCIKFRTMRNNAESIKASLQEINQADGPQFYIENDPRITRTGRVLRMFQIDELPQFINVLRGDMSIVGPRPSPYSENQYCPGWREARLSVRPGLTGLWQVRRTRAAGTDFQEWIRYDIEYVENACWTLDIQIIVQTLLVLLRPLLRS